MTSIGARQTTEQEQGERWEALHQLDEWLQTPMIVLSLVWLLLVLAEFVWGTSRLLMDMIIKLGLRAGEGQR
jgi:voltage-gated potassium channel